MGSRKRRSLIIGGGVIAAAGASTVGAPPAEAATFTVTNLNDAGAGSLRQAIVDSNINPGSDVVTFQAGLTGTITLASQLSISDSVDIQGPGAGVLAVSGNFTSRVFYINNDNLLLDVTVSGLTIRDGVTVGNPNNTLGGGILDNGENLTVDHVVITNNEADQHDSAIGYGGGIWAAGDDDFDLTIIDSTISGNTAVSSGGGVFFNQIVPQVPDFQPTSVSGARPSAVPTSDGDIAILHSTVSGNDAAEAGGVYMGDVYTGQFIVSESTVSANDATSAQGDGGGGILINGGSGGDLIDHSTIADNTSAASGGGIATVDVTMTLDHALLGDNTATGMGPDLASDGSSTLTGAFTFVEDAGGFTLGGTTNSGGSDPQLGALANNGGPTQTHLPALTSPAVNAGNPAYVADAGGDQRHSTRIVGAAVDIGAVETVGPPVNDAYSTPEDTPLVVPTLGVLANDPDGANSTVAIGATLPSHGTVVLNANGSFTYTPVANYNGPDQFTYVQTTVLGVAQTATVNITVTPVNDPPVALNDSATAADNGVGVPVAVLTNDSDPDGDTITVVSVTQASKGTVTFTASGVTYTPTRGTSGVDTFTYTISDGALTATATVTITVAPAPTTTTVPEPVILPATGRDSGPSTELALGLLGAGVVLTAASRRRFRFRRVRD